MIISHSEPTKAMKSSVYGDFLGFFFVGIWSFDMRAPPGCQRRFTAVRTAALPCQDVHENCPDDGNGHFLCFCCFLIATSLFVSSHSMFFG